MKPLDEIIDENFVLRLSRGEPWAFEGQLEDKDGNVEPLAGRTFFGCVMAADGTRLREAVAEIYTDSTGVFYRGVIDGSMSDDLFGQSNLLWWQGERTDAGNKPDAQGSLVIYPGPGMAAPVGPSGVAAVATRYIRRATETGRARIRKAQAGARGPSPWDAEGETLEAYNARVAQGAVDVASEQIGAVITDLGEFTAQRSADIDDAIDRVDVDVAAFKVAARQDVDAKLVQADTTIAKAKAAADAATLPMITGRGTADRYDGLGTGTDFFTGAVTGSPLTVSNLTALGALVTAADGQTVWQSPVTASANRDIAHKQCVPNNQRIWRVEFEIDLAVGAGDTVTIAPAIRTLDDKYAGGAAISATTPGVAGIQTVVAYFFPGAVPAINNAPAGAKTVAYSASSPWLRFYARVGVTGAGGTTFKFRRLTPVDVTSEFSAIDTSVAQVRTMAVGLATSAAQINVPIGSDVVQTSGSIAVGRGAARFTLSPDQASPAIAYRRFQSKNGRWFDLAEPVLTPEMFGAVGDDVANDAVALALAIAAGAALRRPVVLRRKYYVSYAIAADGQPRATDAINLPSDLTLIFDGGRIRYGTFGLPLFWNLNGANIRIERPYVIYDAVATVALPPVTAAFQTLLNRGAWNSAPRDLISMILLLGSRDVVIVNPTLVSKTFGYDTLIKNGITIGTGSTGIRPVVDIIGDTIIDGSYFGVLAWNCERLNVGDIYSDHWGQLDTTVYTWEAPGHVVYYTPQNYAAGAPSTVVFGDCYDLGTMVPGTYAGAGSPSFKFSGRPRNLRVGNLYSLRQAGCLDHNASGAQIGDVYYAPPLGSDAYLTASKAFRFGVNTPGKMTGTIGTIHFEVPSDVAQGSLILGDGLSNMTLRWNIVYNGTLYASGANPLMALSMSNVSLNIALHMPKVQTIADPSGQQVAGPPVVVQLRTGIATTEDGVFNSTNNRITIETDSPQWAVMRVARNGDSAVGNTARITHMASGSYRELGGQSDWGMRRSMMTFTPAAGIASIVAPSLVPKGAVLFGITANINPALGTTTGLTGINVGTAASPTRFGSSTGTAQTLGTDNTTWTDGTVAAQLAALDVVIAAKAGTFDGTGSITVNATYFLALRNNDL